ncbi:MAG: sigma-54-dependent transcriptional regulator [Limimaricola soesokkakensis]|uniref:sigma-54-dependent transcriptional regulator n=1 Tax=Limimaricola soesokkakensis TaxID=1343159 RepID=UPI004058E2F8
MTKRVLLVDDDREVREALGQTLELADLEPILAGSYVAAKDHITPGFDGVIVTDIRMPGRDGFHLLERAREVDPELPVILLTGEGDIPMAVRAMEQGAHAFLEKPCGPKEFVAAVRQALGLRAEVLAARRARAASVAGDAASRMLVGRSAQAEAMRERVRAIARASAEALVCGPPGSGTSKVAEVIHLLSASARAPFVKRTGAALDEAGLAAAIEEAGGGTLYIDEVTTLPPGTQYALLGRLEGGDARPRVLGGSTRDPAAEAEAGRLNPELFWRLDLMRVTIPPLRERPDDIPVLFRHYVAQACEQANLPMPEIDSDLLARLMARDWPGNARALTSVAMRVAMGLDPGLETPASENEGGGLAEQLARVERSLLIEALRRHGGHATRTAEALKLPRKTFYDKLGRHGLRAEDYRRD